jgi:hypothetical protein
MIQIDTSKFFATLLFIDDIDRPVFEILADEHVQSQMNSQKGPLSDSALLRRRSDQSHKRVARPMHEEATSAWTFDVIKHLCQGYARI